MVEKGHSQLSITKQAELLSISRSGLYYTPKPVFDDQAKIVLDKIDEIYTECPFYGTRRMSVALKKSGIKADRKRDSKCYDILRIGAIFLQKRMTVANKEHKIYPYLLRKARNLQHRPKQ